MEKPSRKFQIGADPELFIIDNAGNPYPAIDIVPGDKENPHKISEHGHCVQVDNVMLEFNIPPRRTPEDTWDDIRFVMRFFEDILTSKKMKPHIAASMIFDPKHLQSDKAKEFGCDPDLDVWRELINDPPTSSTNLRTAGGHVHIGYDNPTLEKSAELVKLFDLFVVIPSLFLDTDNRRRQMYGKAGAFRFKDYGVECRQLSNFWIQNIEFVKTIYSQIDKMFEFLDTKGGIERTSSLGKEIVETINTNNKSKAERLIKTFNIIQI